MKKQKQFTYDFIIIFYNLSLHCISRVSSKNVFDNLTLKDLLDAGSKFY
jgi:hypothetical protein